MALQQQNSTLFQIKLDEYGFRRVQGPSDWIYKEDLQQRIQAASQLINEDFGFKSDVAEDQQFSKYWFYPTINQVRTYQFEMVQTSLHFNTLVCLPTGLGKTWIAAIVMLNFYIWYPEGQLYFLAPTKPLVAQQFECVKQFGPIIPKNKKVMISGSISNRDSLYLSHRIFFMTPQTMENDLMKGIIDPRKIVLVVFDEAHKAMGDYSYTKIVKFLYEKQCGFRVLGLSATPGNTLEQVQEVINNLLISKIEYRDDEDPDVKQYIKSRVVVPEIVKNTQMVEKLTEYLFPLIQKLCQTILRSKMAPLSTIRFLKTPAQMNTGITHRLRTEMADNKQKILTQHNREDYFFIMGQIKILSQIVHAKKVLVESGIGSFTDYMQNLKTQTGGLLEIFVQLPEFEQLLMYIDQMPQNNHPKLQRAGEILADFISKNPESKAILFTNGRNTASEINDYLKGIQNIESSVFVGQQSRQGKQDGMNQKMQLEVMQMFKEGKLNVLVATCIAEEGLDIGEVDLIICYDSGFSPIRMIQRMGRTGRKRDGKIIILLTEGKEQRDYDKFLKEGRKIKNQIRQNSLYLTLKKASFSNQRQQEKVKQQLNMFSFNPKMKQTKSELLLFNSFCEVDILKPLLVSSQKSASAKIKKQYKKKPKKVNQLNKSQTQEEIKVNPVNDQRSSVYIDQPLSVTNLVLKSESKNLREQFSMHSESKEINQFLSNQNTEQQPEFNLTEILSLLKDDQRLEQNDSSQDSESQDSIDMKFLQGMIEEKQSTLNDSQISNKYTILDDLDYDFLESIIHNDEKKIL